MLRYFRTSEIQNDWLEEVTSLVRVLQFDSGCGCMLKKPTTWMMSRTNLNVLVKEKRDDETTSVRLMCLPATLPATRTISSLFFRIVCHTTALWMAGKISKRCSIRCVSGQGVWNDCPHYDEQEHFLSRWRTEPIWINNLASRGLITCKYSSFKRIKYIVMHANEQWRLGRLHEFHGRYQYLCIDGPARESMMLVGSWGMFRDYLKGGHQVVPVSRLNLH